MICFRSVLILKKKESEEKIACQYCGMELTKGDRFTHSCKKKPKKV